MSLQPTPRRPVHHDDNLAPDYVAHWVVKTARSKEMIACTRPSSVPASSMRTKDSRS